MFDVSPTSSISSPEIRAKRAVEHAMMARANGAALRTILRSKRLKGDLEYRRTILALREALAEQKARRAEIEARAYEAGWSSLGWVAFYGHAEAMEQVRSSAEFMAAVTLDAPGDRRAYVAAFMAGARDHARAAMRANS